jgi:hypothetical protein
VSGSGTAGGLGAGGATAAIEQPQEEVQKQDFGLLALRGQRRVDVVAVDRALEGL